MLTEVVLKRAGPMTQEALERRVNAFGLPEAKPRVKHGLHAYLRPRHAATVKVKHVTDNRRQRSQEDA